jgi:hypothetical protein
MDYRKRCDEHWPKPWRNSETGNLEPRDAGLIRTDKAGCAQCDLDKYGDAMGFRSRSISNESKP